MFDLGPAAQEMSRLVTGVRDDDLDAPTPCTDWSVTDLLAHVRQLATVFRLNAAKQPVPPVAGLPDDWRTSLPQELVALAEAWRAPEAWEGRVSAGGADLTGAQNALVAAEELALHGWDLARATGQEARLDEAALDRVEAFQAAFAGAFPPGRGPYGPPLDVPADAPRLDRLLGAAGRDPAWSATR